MAIDIEDPNKSNQSRILENLMAMEADSKEQIKTVAESPTLLKDYFADDKQLKKAQGFQLAALKQGDISPSLAKEASPVFAKLQTKLEADPTYAEADAETKLALAQEQLKASKDKSMSAGEIFARSLIALAPALVGYGLGGSLGGIAGAEASKETLKTAAELEKAQKESKEKEEERKLKIGLELLKSQKDIQKAAREEGFKEKELELKERGVIAQEREAGKKAQDSDKGKILTGEQTKLLAGFKSSEDQLNGIEREIDKNADFMGPALGRLFGKSPYATETLAFDARMKLAAQKIGVALEGGKLTDEDIARYRQMLPNLTDTPEVARAKVGIVRELLATEQASQLSTLGAGGYDVSRLATPQPPQSAPAVKTRGVTLPGQIKEAQAAPKPKRIMQNGIEYTLNPATGQYE